jgi:hypothetical protein
VPRKKAKRANSEVEPIDESALAFGGSLRAADEDEGLDVVISKTGGRVVMRAGGAQLGRWLLADVTIRRLDDATFEFIAEDDHLVFTPSDPSALAASPLVAQEEEVKSGRLRRRSVKKKSSKSDPSSPDTAKPVSKTSRRHEPASSEPSAEKTPEPPQTDVAIDTTESPDAEREAPADDTVDSEVGGVTGESISNSPSGSERRGLRLRMLDVARHNDLFDLERVPIDERLRGSEHEHSWDHRVATGTGLSSRVCTICGKIRLSKSS